MSEIWMLLDGQKTLETIMYELNLKKNIVSKKDFIEAISYLLQIEFIEKVKENLWL